jgi:hypothetical protein
MAYEQVMGDRKRAEAKAIEETLGTREQREQQRRQPRTPNRFG